MSYRPNALTTIHQELALGGIPLRQLAQTYKTPLYILDAQTIKDQCKAFRETLAQLHADSMVLYASKANLTVGIAQFIAQQGLGMDVVSGGELYTALQANVAPHMIYFHGNNKSEEEIAFGISSGVTFVIDNAFELKRISYQAQQQAQKTKVMLRVIPNVEAETHSYIKTGQADSKFGVDTQLAISLITQMHTDPFLQFQGIHHHIGSQILSPNPYLDLADIAVSFLYKVTQEHGIPVPMLNLGGGFGIQYTQETEPHPSSFLIPLITKVKEKCAQKNLAVPTLLIEPGRSIIGRAGVTLYQVGAVKQAASKRFLFVDGGMADNPRPMMYQAKHAFEWVVENKNPLQRFTIAGKYCESGDILAENIELPEPGDQHSLLAAFGTGAYNYVMASHYNRACRPAMVLVEDGKVIPLIKRERYSDLTAFDLPYLHP